MPERFAHGYQVLEDNTETSYQVGEFYTPGVEGGLLYNDPRLGLAWPLPVGEMSQKDAGWPLLDEIEPELKRRMNLRETETANVQENAMILVDNALKAREQRASRSASAWSAPASWARG